MPGRTRRGVGRDGMEWNGMEVERGRKGGSSGDQEMRERAIEPEENEEMEMRKSRM